ncbi:MAG: hypothetical protein ACI4R9_02045 [Kiritimatiellia bacterium]
MILGMLLAAGLSATRAEIVTAEFASADEAERAQIAIAPLPEGRKLAFTSRWDDSTWPHIQRAEMFQRTGVTPMFFLNGDLKFYREAVPQLKRLGARFGNHTLDHPFLMESGVNRMFRQVLENKIRLECFTDMPNTSFVIPFNWNCSLEPTRAAKLAKILVDAGIFVSSDWPLAATEQPASAWMPGFTFKGNDNQPNDGEFYHNLSNAVADVAQNPDYPKITFGIHSWCKPEGLLVQEKWLRQICAEHGDDWWITDDAHYGAYRYEFWHAKTRKLGVKGRTAVFEVQRHDPAFLGEVQPLTYVFGAAKAVKVSVHGGYAASAALPARIDRMERGASAKFPDLRLTVAVDERKGELSYAFTGDAQVLAVVVNPAPMWSEGRILAEEAAKTVRLGTANPQTDYHEGDRLYVVGVDFLKDGVRGRLYATETVAGKAASLGGTPRDTLRVLGPIDVRDFDAAKVSALAVPDVTLPNYGESIHQYWRSMADRNRCGFSAAAYIPWDPSVSAEFKNALGKAQPKDRPVFLAAVDFICAADGEKDLLVNRAKWETTAYWINGRYVETKGGRHRLAVKKGLNRLIYRWEWFQPWIPQACLLSVCDDQDVNKAVTFVAPKTAARDGVFSSDGFSVEFDPKGDFRTIEYAGRKVFSALGYESGKSLPVKKGVSAKVSCKSSADKIVCTRESPFGLRSDDFAEKITYTVTRDTIAFTAEMTVRQGVMWKGFNACASIQTPVSSFYAGRRLRFVDAKGVSHEIDYPVEFDAKTCRLMPSFVAFDNGEWKIELGEGTQQMGFVDRRQWNNDSACLQLCPRGGLQWAGKVSDGTTFVWSWTISRVNGQGNGT